MYTAMAAIFRRKLLVLAIFTTIALLSTVYTLTAPKMYEARMKVFVKHERAANVVTSNGANSAGANPEVSESEVTSEIELLTNPDLLRRVVTRTRLVQNELRTANERPEELVEREVRTVAKNLRVSPVRKANTIQVSYSSLNPTQSLTLLQSLSELYLQDHLRLHRTTGAHEFFRTQAAAYQHQLNDAQSRLSEFRRTHNVSALAEQKDLTLRRLMETQQTVNEVSAAIQEAQSRVRTLKAQLVPLDSRVITQTRVVPNQYSIERLHTMLAELQNRRTDLLTKFRSDDRLVREVDDQIKDTNAAMNRASKLTSVEQTTDVNPLRQTLEADLAHAQLTQAGLVSRAETLDAALRSWRVRLAKLDEVTSEHDTLNRKVKEAEENLTLYSKKQEEARIEDSLDALKIANVSILEPPVKPTLPSKPNVPTNLAVGFLLAAFVSLGTAFVLEMNRCTFETFDELESATDVPVLAVIRTEGV
jgi:uncharacterized protein involved in exopolysaccharide biosynthesis